MVQRLGVSWLLASTLVLAACTGSENEGGDSTPAVLPSTTTSVISTTSSEASSTTKAPSPMDTVTAVDLTSVLVLEDAGLGGVVVPDDGLPFLVLDADGAVRTVKCLNETCTEYEFGASFSSRRGISFLFGPPNLAVGPSGFPVFVFVDFDSEEGDTARFNDRLPPDNRMHLVRCLDAGCTEVTDTDLGAGDAHSLKILGDGTPILSYSAYGESRDDLRDWGLAKVMSCGDPACVERVETWIGELKDARTQVFIGSDGFPVVAYGLDSGDEIGAVFCDDPECVSHERVAVVSSTVGIELIEAATGTNGPMFAYRAGPQLYSVTCRDGRCADVGPPVPVGSEMAYGAVQAVWRLDGTPVFVFTDAVGFELDVAACEGVGCEDASAVRVAENVDGFGLTVDADGNTVVLCNGVLIRCVDPGCWLGGEASSLWDESLWDEADRILPPMMEGWHLAGVLGDRGSGTISVVTEGGPGLVALGQDCGLDATGVPGCESKAWVSEDGRDWQEADTLGDGVVSVAAASGSKILAGGSREFTDAGVETAAPALWLSTDGHRWELVSIDDDLFGGCTPDDPVSCSAEVSTIVTLGEGFWAMGRNTTGPVAWVSNDGLSWEASGHPLEAFDDSDLTAGTWANWAVVGGNGIIASGETCRPGPVCDLLAATSVDGLTWRPLDPPFDSDGDINFYHPRTWSGGFVAVAELCDVEGECILSMATSTDAVTWLVVPIEDAFAPVYVQTLYEFGDGVVGIGGLPNERTGIADPVFIHTDDLTTWTIESGDPELFPPDRHAINDTIQFGDRFIAVGMTQGGPTAWWYGE